MDRLHLRISFGLLIILGACLLIPVAASACSNEARRLESHSNLLPDCRAYELVTPPYKEGTFVTSLFSISEDGEHLVGADVASYGETESESFGPGSNLVGTPYEYSRTDSGWTAAPLAPPASIYASEAGLFDVSADSSATLWEFETLAQSREPEHRDVADFYLEEPRGTFREIGRVTPNPNVPNQSLTGPLYRYAGGSAKLTHVLYTIEPGLRWPFDSTIGAGNTLYEYVGIAGTQAEREAREPWLVGVNGGRGSVQLISQCGTRLGSSTKGESPVPSGSTYNAISASGMRIFFTAVGREDHECSGEQPPVDELFAREELQQGEPQQGELRTVPISEPTPEACSACIAEPPEGPQDAIFQGASQDGSKVFFTSTQRLLPGASEAEANLYEYDFDRPPGERLVLVSGGGATSGVQGVLRVSEDGSHIYFVSTASLTGANAENGAPTAGKDNLYVFELDERHPEGRVTFIASLSEEDNGNWIPADERSVQASKNGRYLIFFSTADLKHEGARGGIFQYDAETGSLVRASIGQGGYANDGRTLPGGVSIVTRPPASYTYTQTDSPSLADGVLAPENGAVFFMSPAALTPQALADQTDANGELVPNVYEYHNGSLSLISDGLDISMEFDGPSTALVGSDASGEDVFFTTADPLAPQDVDTQQDIYDARTEGGFPLPSASFGCAGEACHGAASAPLVLATPGSATQAGEAGISPPAALPLAKTKPKPKLNAKKKTKKKKKKHGSRAARATRDNRTRGRARR
jgi:hypothetical protein